MSDALTNRIAWVEIGLTALLVAFFATDIRETDDIWALTLVSIVLTTFPFLVIFAPKVSSFWGKAVKLLALGLWPFLLFWLLAYA